MGKSVHNDVLDGMLNIILNNATRLCVCSAEPTTFAEATTTYDGGASKYKLAIHTLTSGDFAVADDTSGRKITMSEQAAITVDATASATHVALCDSANSKLLYVTTCTSQSLTLGNTVTVPSFKIGVADPT
jgi:hypothetical protein